MFHYVFGMLGMTENLNCNFVESLSKWDHEVHRHTRSVRDVRDNCKLEDYNQTEWDESSGWTFQCLQLLVALVDDRAQLGNSCFFLLHHVLQIVPLCSKTCILLLQLHDLSLSLRNMQPLVQLKVQQPACHIHCPITK